MYPSNAGEKRGIILKLVQAFLEIVESILGLVQLHINLAEVEEHVHCTEVLEGGLELGLSIAIQTKSREKELSTV